MNQEIKERYKYTDIEAILTSGTGKAKVEAKVEANCEIYNGYPEQLNLTPTDDPMVEHNLAVSEAHGVYLSVPRNKITEGVVTIHLYYSGNGSAVLRNVVELADGAQIKIVIEHHKAEQPDTVINSILVVKAGRGAVAEVVEIACSGATLLSTLVVEQHEHSVVRMTTLDIENRTVIRNQDIALRESGADCSLSGLYLTTEQERCDNYIRVRHLSAGCTSNQDYKGVMSGRSVASFTGSIFVEKDAQKTAAYQQNNNILLNDKARIYTRPQLEIYADDVKCNHGATVGKLDPEAIYYMRQRGIPTEAARRLQIAGFAEQVVRLENIGEWQGVILDKISRRLAQI